MSMIGVLLGMAVLTAMAGFFLAVIRIISLPLPIIQRFLLIGVSFGGITGALYGLYFLLSWLPYDLGSCVGMFSCAGEKAIEDLVAARWSSALAAIIGLALSLCCFVLGLRHIKHQEENHTERT